MADTSERPVSHDERARNAPAPEPARLPYEPPRLLKKRSVANATLFTVVGATMMGLTATG
jgi:hypothetical protein